MDKYIYDCIIIGAGISGISFAHYLTSIDQNILILEKDGRAGGQIHSLSSNQDEQYWRELGSHTCYNSYTSFLSILKDIKAEDKVQLLNKVSYVLYDNKIKSISSGISILSCILSIPKILFANKDKSSKTVKEYFCPIFGSKNYNKLFTNAFRAVICQPADDYPAEIFLKHRKDRYKEFPRKYSLKNGLSSFIKTVIEKNKLNVKTNSEVISISIEKQDSLYIIETKNGEIYQTKNIALACNPQTDSKLLINIESDLSNLLGGSIPSFSSESLNVIILKEKLKIKPVAGIISLSDEFMSAVSRDTVDDDRYRSFTFHFEKGKKTDDEKSELICKVLEINRQDIVEQSITEHLLPSVRMQHLHIDKQISDARQNNSIYILGNYFYGLSIEDCINRSKDEFETV